MASRLLPDGTPASSEEDYAEAWMLAGNTFGALLPGWRFAGCGPNLEFVRYGVTGLGDTIVVDRLSISPEAARTIQAEVERRVADAEQRVKPGCHAEGAHARIDSIVRFLVPRGFDPLDGMP